MPCYLLPFFFFITRKPITPIIITSATNANAIVVPSKPENNPANPTGGVVTAAPSTGSLITSPVSLMHKPFVQVPPGHGVPSVIAMLLQVVLSWHTSTVHALPSSQFLPAHKNDFGSPDASFSTAAFVSEDVVPSAALTAIVFVP